MERGFYHPLMGYWQTTGYLTDSILNSYPEGTIEVPAKPGDEYEFNGTEWVPTTTVANPNRVSMVLSFSQLMIGLVTEGWITEAEGYAWLTNSALPQKVLDVVNMLPENARFSAHARLLRMSVAERLNPLLVAMASADGRSEEEVDDFFQTYANV